MTAEQSEQTTERPRTEFYFNPKAVLVTVVWLGLLALISLGGDETAPLARTFSTPLGMAICSVVLGLALGSVQPMVMSTLHQITPEARHGEALGLRLMAVNASSVLMPVMFGTVGAIVGVSVMFWVVGSAVGATVRVAWHLRPDPAQ